MSLNVFTWIREGVKQSVLLGVADALEDIGAAPDGDNLQPRIRERLSRQVLASPIARSDVDAKPKRLGRSLKDLDAE